MDSATTVAQIRTLLTEKLQATEVEIQDDSHRHAGHQGHDDHSRGGHFSVRVVSAQFAGKTPLQQHRLVYEALEEIRPQIHALALKTQTPAAL